MHLIGAMDEFTMPEFRDEDGSVWHWDSTSQSYIVGPGGGLPDPDRGHATGGDNDLFDPFQHTEEAGSPETEGYMSSVREAQEWAPPGQVICPNCTEATTEHVCPTCSKDLTPEWNQEQGNEFMGVMPQHSDASEFTSWPMREPKRNRMHTDDSFSSETTASVYEMAVKLASFQITADEWDDMFSGEAPAKVEIGKWLIDKSGNLHIDHGMHALHEKIAERDGIQYPGEVGALGSVYNDGTADTQRVFPGFQFDEQAAQSQITQAFGPVTLQGPVGQGGAAQKGPTFEPFEVRGGQWVVAPHFAQQPLTGVAWVKERPEGVSFQPNMILVAEHLQPEDFALWSRGVTAIVTATGGLTSHAAYLASTEGIPVVVGIGAPYNNIETGDYLKIEPSTQTITVMPGASGSMSPDQKQNVWDSYLQYQLQRGGSLKPEFFSHIDDELAWREANTPTLDSCPECGQPMVDQGGESVCHGCGHKQPIIQHNAAVLAPLGEAAIGGLGEAGAGGAAGGAGLMGGGSGISGVGGLMQKALNGAAFRGGENALGGGGDAGTAGDSENFDSGAETQGVISKTADTFGEEEDGRGTKNRGDDSNPDTQTSSGSNPDEHGDSPEQLKDAEIGTGGADNKDQSEEHQGDPALQDKAMKAFHLNLPLVIEFANSDEAGGDNPIIRALDDLLEEAFPGYKDGHDDLAAESEHPVEEIHEEIHPEEKSDDPNEERSDPKEASVWHFADFEDALADLPPVTSEQDPDAEAPYADAMWADTFPHEAAAWGTPQTPLPGTSGAPANLGDLNAMQGAPMMPGAPGAPGAAPVGAGTCPMCGQSHLPGTPCPTPATNPNQIAAPAATGGQVTPPQPQTVVTKWHVVEAGDRLDHFKDRAQQFGQGAATAVDAIGGGAAAIRDGFRDTVGLWQTCPQCQQAKLKPFSDHSGYEACPSCGYKPMPIDRPEHALGDSGNYAFGDAYHEYNHDPEYGRQQMLGSADGESVVTAGLGEMIENGISDIPRGINNGVRRVIPGVGQNCPECGGHTTISREGLHGDFNQCTSCGAQIPLHSPTASVSDPEFAFFTAAGEGEHHHEHEVEHHPHAEEQHHDPTTEEASTPWLDESGAPLQEGADYELKSSDYAIPDRITIDRILPEKLVFTIHSGDVDYRDEISTQDIQTNGYSFAPAGVDDAQVDSIDGFQPEAPIRPGQDATPQVDDLSTPSSVVSRSEGEEIEYMAKFAGDKLADRTWLMEGGSSEVDVDPTLMAKLAGKAYSPREQREFIDESGEARNLDRLDLDGTHYITNDIDGAFNW